MKEGVGTRHEANLLPPRYQGEQRCDRSLSHRLAALGDRNVLVYTFVKPTVIIPYSHPESMNASLFHSVALTLLALGVGIIVKTAVCHSKTQVLIYKVRICNK